eukprot:9301173-Pyramimonas_sp.AAC.1
MGGPDGHVLVKHHVAAYEVVGLAPVRRMDQVQPGDLLLTPPDRWRLESTNCRREGGMHPA